MKNLMELEMNELDAILKENEYVVLDFHAIWCPPCLMLGKTIKALANAYMGRIQFVKINIDKHKELCETMNVKSIPTLILVYKQKEQMRVSGFKTRKHLEQMLDMFLKGTKEN